MIDKTVVWKAWNMKPDTWSLYESLRSKDQIQDDVARMVIKFFIKEAKIADDMDRMNRAKLAEVLPPELLNQKKSQETNK